MGFFRSIGRQVEEFKQTAKQSAEESAAYHCRSCEERFHRQHEQCPECGAETVTETRTEEE